MGADEEVVLVDAWELAAGGEGGGEREGGFEGVEVVVRVGAEDDAAARGAGGVGVGGFETDGRVGGAGGAAMGEEGGGFVEGEHLGELVQGFEVRLGGRVGVGVVA